MEISPVFEATTPAVPSPNGQYIASVTAGHLYVQYAYSLETAFTFPLNATSSATATTRSGTPAALSIQWSHTSHHILLISTQGLNVYSLSDTDRDVRISNGSAGLGRIVAAEMLGLTQGGEQVLVFWEFGRCAVWDLQTGRAAEELGDMKMGSGRLGDAWGLRRTEGKAEVLAILGRSGAQDTLNLFLPPSTTPFVSITLPTVDAQSIAWSENWLSVLDSPLASPAPSLYIYTPDGHLFRTFPAASPVPIPGSIETTTSTDEDEIAALGPKSLSWSQKHLALASSTGSKITLLSTRSFTPTIALDPSNTPPEFCHQETISARSGNSRTYNLLASNSIPQPPGGLSALGPVTEMKWSKGGNWLAVRYEALPSTTLIWRIPEIASSAGATGAGIEPSKIDAPIMITQHNPIRRLLWHPHPARDSLLTLIGEEQQAQQPRQETAVQNGIYFFDAAIDQPPVFVAHPFSALSAAETGRVDVRWIASDVDDGRSGRSGLSGGEEAEKLKLLVSSRKQGWFIIYPEGREEVGRDATMTMSMSTTMTQTRDPTEPTVSKVRVDLMTPSAGGASSGGTGPDLDADEEGDVSQDSLYDILSGRTPLPELGSGRVIANDDERMGEQDVEDEEMMRKLDDTFRAQRGRRDNISPPSGNKNLADETVDDWDDEIF